MFIYVPPLSIQPFLTTGVDWLLHPSSQTLALLHRSKKLPPLWELFRFRAVTTVLITCRTNFRVVAIAVWSGHIAFLINIEAMNTTEYLKKYMTKNQKPHCNLCNLSRAVDLKLSYKELYTQITSLKLVRGISIGCPHRALWNVVGN
jgi:hypothetical protein